MPESGEARPCASHHECTLTTSPIRPLEGCQRVPDVPENGFCGRVAGSYRLTAGSFRSTAMGQSATAGRYQSLCPVNHLPNTMGRCDGRRHTHLRETEHIECDPRGTARPRNWGACTSTSPAPAGSSCRSPHQKRLPRSGTHRIHKCLRAALQRCTVHARHPLLHPLSALPWTSTGRGSVVGGGYTFTNRSQS